MDILLQQLVNGLVLGSLYALVALGYTMVYGVLGLINFAHGDVLMVGALVALSAIAALLGLWPEAPGWLALLWGMVAAIPVCMALSAGIERLAYRPLRNAPRLAPLISAIGVSIILQTLAMIIWGRNYLIFPTTLPTEMLTLATFAPLPSQDGTLNTDPRTVSIAPIQLLIVVLSGLIMLVLAVCIQRTAFGRAVRATAERPDIAGLMGIAVNRVVLATFMLGAALAAVAGVMMAANYSIAHFYMGFIPGLKAFTAAVLGGIGNIYGAMLGGLVLGLLESLAAGYLGSWTGGFLGSHYQDIVAFAVLIVVLTLKPSGLLGGTQTDRA
jgi:branched-chain amino acid transport system permease protein